MSDVAEMFDGLLDSAVRPTRVQVTVAPTRISLRFPSPTFSTLPFTRAGLSIGVCLAIAAFFVWNALPVEGNLFWTGLLLLLSLPPLGAAIGAGAQFVVSEQQRMTLRTLELHTHRAELFGSAGTALATWSMHDIEELWSSRDVLGFIVGVRRAGEVEAIRVDSSRTALWLIDVMRAWRTERVLEPDEGGLDAIASLAARANENAAR